MMKQVYNSVRNIVSNIKLEERKRNNVPAHGSIWMNVDLKYLRDLRLQELRQDKFARIPQAVCHSVRLQCVKALEIQKYIR
jgi:hypothetical protein